MSIQINSGFITHPEPPVIPVSLEKTDPQTVQKSEPPEFEIAETGMDDTVDSLDEKITPDIKDIDIVSHMLCEDSIKSETVSKNILETKYSESVETQVIVKTENVPYVKIENVTQSDHLINTSDENVIRVTGQGVVEVQGSNEHFNTVNNLETNEHLEHADFAKCNKTISWENNKEKIQIIEAPVIPVEPHEYTRLAKNKHVCNHCQLQSTTLEYVKCHIKTMHRKVTPMFQCLYCPYESKWSSNLRTHISQKHQDNKYRCGKCDYSTSRRGHFKRHKLVHLKLEEIQYFYCYHCSYKYIYKTSLKTHIFKHFRNEDVPFHCYICDFVTLKRDLIIEHIKTHSKVQLETHTKKPEKIYCCEKYAFVTREHSYFKPHGQIQAKGQPQNSHL